nr:RHS repeat-associated core domain-containing protein [Burkholderia stabilis]
MDDAGKVVRLGRYRAWGGEKTVWRETAERNEATNPIRFPGQYCDEETGLYYNRYRYYDPGTGRFISKDPIGLQGGINVFLYAPNPVSWIDPLGLARSGQWVTVGNGRIRIDPPHVENTNQQIHAHCQCKSRKQEVVVNKDGTQSHGSRGEVSGLTRTEKDYLREKGFDL